MVVALLLVVVVVIDGGGGVVVVVASSTRVVGWLLDINIVVVYLLTYISQSADYLRVRSSLVPSVACQTTEGEYLLLTTTLHLLIPCSYLQVYTNIIVACQTTEVTYRSSYLPSRH